MPKGKGGESSSCTVTWSSQEVNPATGRSEWKSHWCGGTLRHGGLHSCAEMGCGATSST